MSKFEGRRTLFPDKHFEIKGREDPPIDLDLYDETKILSTEIFGKIVRYTRRGEFYIPLKEE